jgi:hypothetical protein
LAGCHTAIGAAAACEQELARPFAGGLEIVIDRLTGLLAQFKSDKPPCFLPPVRCAIRRVSAGSNILYPDRNDITGTEPAVDCQIEHGEIAIAALDLELCADRPDVFRSQRWLCPGQFSLIRGTRLDLGLAFTWSCMAILLGSVIENKKHVPLDQALELGRFSDHSGRKQRVAFDPQRTSDTDRLSLGVYEAVDRLAGTIMLMPAPPRWVPRCMSGTVQRPGPLQRCSETQPRTRLRCSSRCGRRVR